MARSLTHRALARHHLISVAGLVGRPVRLTDGPQIGRVADVVVRWASDTYPAVTGLVARMAGHRTFVPFARIMELGGDVVVLSSSVLDLRAFERRDGETLLMADVVDHQLVDVNGVQVVRASDLYLAEVGARVRLVGVETGILPLASPRAGPLARTRHAEPGEPAIADGTERKRGRVPDRRADLRRGRGSAGARRRADRCHVTQASRRAYAGSRSRVAKLLKTACSFVAISDILCGRDNEGARKVKRGRVDLLSRRPHH